MISLFALFAAATLVSAVGGCVAFLRRRRSDAWRALRFSTLATAPACWLLCELAVWALHRWTEVYDLLSVLCVVFWTPIGLALCGKALFACRCQSWRVALFVVIQVVSFVSATWLALACAVQV